MICQSCGVEAPTRYVAFYQNIGALLMSFTRSIEGNLCKRCIHRYFWKFTLTNCTLGWWSVHALFFTPFLILNNIGRYAFCLTMDPVPPGATQPELTEAEIERITSHASDLFERLNAGDKLEDVAQVIAERARVTPGQIALYMHLVAEAAEQE